VKSVHLILLQAQFYLTLLNFIVFVFNFLVLSRFSLFKFTSSFFNEAIVLDELLLRLCYLGHKHFLLRVKICNVLFLVREEVAELLTLDHCASQPLITFINLLSALD